MRLAAQPARAGAVLRRCSCDRRGAGGACEACGQERAGTLARSAGAAARSGPAPVIVQQVLGEPGQALDAGTRSFMEGRFHRDFGAIRVHTDARAAASATAVGATAYAVGSDLVFAAGRYQPTETHGRRLLAHELAHSLQHAPGPASGLQLGDPMAAEEREADSLADAVVHGAPLPARSGPRRGAVVARDDDLSRDIHKAAERASRYDPLSRPHVPKSPIEPGGPMPAGVPRRGVVPCDASPHCQAHVPGSSWDFSNKADREEKAQRAAASTSGTAAAIVPSVHYEQFRQDANIPLPTGMRGINVNPALDTPVAPTAQVGGCRAGASATRTAGFCMEIPSRFERGAAQFNKGDKVITADERCGERARDLERESLKEVSQPAGAVTRCPRDLWQKWALTVLVHEVAHRTFDTGPSVGPSDVVSQHELSELFAQLSEWPGIFSWAAGQRVSAARKLAYLHNQGDELVDNQREGVRGILTKLRCINPCSDVNDAVTKSFRSVTQGWSPDMRDSVLRELADPARHLGWPIPAPPDVKPPEPDPADRPKFGPLYRPRRTFVPELERSLEDL